LRGAWQSAWIEPTILLSVLAGFPGGVIGGG
jgi:hypothetical protein